MKTTVLVLILLMLLGLFTSCSEFGEVLPEDNLDENVDDEDFDQEDLEDDEEGESLPTPPSLPN